MPIRLSDTQKITNVPSSRDIGSLVNLDTSRDPNVNQPTPPLPRIQSGLSSKTDTFELIDRIDFSSTNNLFGGVAILTFPFGNYRQYKLVLNDVDNFTAGTLLSLSFDMEQSNQHYSEFVSYNGSSATVQQSFTATTSFTLGNASSFQAGLGGIFGDIDIFSNSFTLSANIGSGGGIRARWNLNCWNQRTFGHGSYDSGNYQYRGVSLRFSYVPAKGTIAFYGLPRY